MQDLSEFRAEINSELTRILDYWQKNAPDTSGGGFIGRVDHSGKRFPEAEKGSVLNSRILWTFSAAYQRTQNPAHLRLAKRAFEYIRDHFYDHDNGGTYWSVKADGSRNQTRKQVYGQAFTIYGLSEYFSVSEDVEALALATELYEKLEDYSYEPEKGGYIEAFSTDWQPLEDMRLGGGGLNSPKTMNTHLHVIEAYVNLYLVWPDIRLRKSIEGLLEVFEKHIINPETHQMTLYSGMDWTPHSKAMSFGHDIEASWLLLESAEVLHNSELTDKWKNNAVAMAEGTLAGLAPDGTLYYEYDPETNHWNKDRQWWVSCEAVVGFLNAWQISGNEKYLRQMFASWEFAKKYLLDKKGGEWFTGVKDDYSVVNGSKIGFWKGPYHNARMCFEVLKRLPA